MEKELMDENSNDENKYDRAIYGTANVQQYKSDVAFKTLVEAVNDNLYIVPNFQRMYKWEQYQVQDLAVSLLRGLPIPPIYTYRNELGQLEILDGQQRIISIFLYYLGKYRSRTRNKNMNIKQFDSSKPFKEQIEHFYELSDVTYYMKYYDDVDAEEKSIVINYDKLPDKVRRKLDYTTITVIEISIDNKELKNKYLYKIFANLNAGGIPLTAQEIRNVIYRCPFYEMLFEFNETNEKWLEAFGNVSDESRRIESLLRLCAFRYFVKIKDNKFTIDSYKNIQSMLNEFSEKAVKFEEKDILDYKNSLEIFADKWNGRIIREQSILENIYTVVDKTEMDVALTSYLCKKIQDTELYRETVRQGNATKAVIEKKLKAVYDGLQKYA